MSLLNLLLTKLVEYVNFPLMEERIFWTEKRLEALGKTALTLFQGFVLAGILGGVFGKIVSVWLKIIFIIAMIVLLMVGILFADKIRGGK